MDGEGKIIVGGWYFVITVRAALVTTADPTMFYLLSVAYFLSGQH
jgi:hypothetical protein